MIQEQTATPIERVEDIDPRAYQRLDGADQIKVAYMMSRFPKITETFILYEMLAMEQHGVTVEVYPIQREKTNVIHPEAQSFVARANFLPWVNGDIVAANVRMLRRKPLTYLHTLWTLIRANLGSRWYLSGKLALFPKSVRFAEMMEADEITHIHAHFASFPAAAAYIVHRLTGIPYSFTGHGSDLNRDRHMLKEKVEAATTVVPISEFFRRMILEECGLHNDTKVVVVHVGVDTAVFEPRTEPTPFEKGEGPFVITAVGTLHEVKGQTYLIQACREMKKRGVEFQCHFVGDGPDETELRRQVSEWGLDDNVIFHLRQPREFVVGILKKTDVLVQASVPSSDGRREGIPVVLMEAMGSGVPVISTRMSGIPELVHDGECGLLVEPKEVGQLADAIQRLYDDAELRQRFGVSGREKVIREFDLNLNAVTLAQYFTKRDES